jgi:putative membrane protein
MSEERILWEAEFNPKVTWYWLLSGTIILTVIIVTIPLVPLWLIFGQIVTRKYLASHKCTLNNRSLKFSKGVFVRQEKTVPLDRITDLGLTQGPIMRALDIEALSVETAGQSSPGSLIQLAGIKDGRAFRDAVLAQRDLVVGSKESQLAGGAPTVDRSGDATQHELLGQIRDTLQRIEVALQQRS